MTSSVPHPAAWLVLAVAVTVALGLGGLASSAPSNAHPSAQSVGAYPWPIRPFNQAHPVRANLGDPRTLFATRSGNPLAAAGTFAFHDGVDIDAAAAETPVYPVASGVAYPLASGSGVGVNATDGRSFEYEHIVPAVSSGQPVTAGQTILGHVRNWAEEVHLQGAHRREGAGEPAAAGSSHAVRRHDRPDGRAGGDPGPKRRSRALSSPYAAESRSSPTPTTRPCPFRRERAGEASPCRSLRAMVSRAPRC